MAYQFPRTTVGGVSLSRMIIGTNWLAGWSHRTPAQDEMIAETHSTTDVMGRMLDVYLANGVDTLMAPLHLTPTIYRAVQEAEQRNGRKIILVDTPIINVDDNADARRETEAMIKQSRQNGATFCLVHHSSAEKLVDKGAQKIRRLDDYTKMIRDNGLIPGLSAHMPELIVYSDLNNYDVETYIQIYNCLGFLMQVEIETVAGIIHNAKKPVMSIKSMAAGRCTPFVGLNFSWATLRDCDMVTVGCYNEREAAEVIEISRAAFEHRLPNVGPRTSPIQNQDAFGGDKG